MYNFERIVDRSGTGAVNFDDFKGYISRQGGPEHYKYRDEEFIRMWIADMEFAVAPEIQKALHDRVDREIFGYTAVLGDSYFSAFRHWCESRYGWSPRREELCCTAGVIPALFQLVESLCTQGDRVILTTPSYSSFQRAAAYSGVGVLTSPLRQDENGAFVLDLSDLERQCAHPHARVLIWCNPHNPTGRVWTPEELRQVAALVEKYNLWLISDEIHCDLTRRGITHTPMAKVMPDYQKLITCMAPTKTFNLAGLAFSNILIRDGELRQEFRSRDKLMNMANPMSLTAAQAAYGQGGPWLEALQEYLDGNFRYVKDFLTEKLPKANMAIPEATYLAWVDMRAYLGDVENLTAFFAKEAGVVLEGGDENFVGNAQGFIRLNLAMPRSMVETGMERIAAAVLAHGSK